MRIPNGKDCYPSFTGCFGNDPCLFTLQNAYFVRKRGSPLLVYCDRVCNPFYLNIFFLGWWGCTVTFGQVNQIGARHIYRTVGKRCSGKIFAHRNAVRVWQSISCFYSLCVTSCCQMWRWVCCQQSLQPFVRDILILVSLVCVFRIKQSAITTLTLFPYYFSLLTLNFRWYLI